MTIGFGYMDIVQASDIKNKTVLNYIVNKDKEIKSFIKNINKLFPEDFKLLTDKMNVEIRIGYDNQGSYENDGNTRCPGNDYIVQWICPFTEDADTDGVYFYNGMLANSMSFSFKLSERVSDGKINDYKPFSGYLNKSINSEDNYDMWRFCLNNINLSAVPYIVLEVEKMKQINDIRNKMLGLFQ